jgi:hypothetical protein
VDLGRLFALLDGLVAPRNKSRLDHVEHDNVLLARKPG